MWKVIFASRYLEATAEVIKSHLQFSPYLEQGEVKFQNEESNLVHVRYLSGMCLTYNSQTLKSFLMMQVLLNFHTLHVFIKLKCNNKVFSLSRSAYE